MLAGGFHLIQSRSYLSYGSGPWVCIEIMSLLEKKKCYSSSSSLMLPGAGRYSSVILLRYTRAGTPSCALWARCKWGIIGDFSLLSKQATDTAPAEYFSQTALHNMAAAWSPQPWEASQLPHPGTLSLFRSFNQTSPIFL